MERRWKQQRSQRRALAAQLEPDPAKKLRSGPTAKLRFELHAQPHLEKRRRPEAEPRRQIRQPQGFPLQMPTA